MTGKTSPCQSERLKALLYADEASHEYALALQHIENCPACCTKLEEMAASKEMWHDSHVALTEDLSNWPFKSSGEANLSQRWQQPASAQAWTETLARQLLEPPSHPEMLGRLGRYEIERLIGSGGMGVVFKAFDTDLNRPVAIKVLAPHLAGNGAARQRFAREARAAAAVVHEHIVAIHNVESNQPAPFLVMHYVAGESLQQRIDRCGSLNLPEILRIALQTAAGLAAAHAQGLVHRDIKPANILLEEGIERALLTDFGLARTNDDASLTHTGYHLGTPQYMSPEQAAGEPIDARSDLFSLGSVIYTMCTGRPPFRAETTLGILRRISDHEPRPMREVNASIPVWLERLVKRLHAKSPQQRYNSAQQVRTLLEQCLAHVQQPTTATLPAELLSDTQSPVAFARRRSLRTIVAGIAGIAALMAILVSALWNQPSEQVPPAQEETKPGDTSQADTRPWTEWEWGTLQLQSADDEIRQLEQATR